MFGFPKPLGTALSTLRAVPRRQYFFTATGFRPRPHPYTWQRLQSIRQATTEAGEENSGHIDAGPNEGILFFDSMSGIIKLQQVSATMLIHSYRCLPSQASLAVAPAIPSRR